MLSVLRGLSEPAENSASVSAVDVFVVNGTSLKGIRITPQNQGGFEVHYVPQHFIIVGRESSPKYVNPNGEVDKASLILSLVPAQVKVEGNYTLLDSFSYKAPQKILKVLAEAKTDETESLDSAFSLVDAVLSSNDEEVGKFTVKNLQGVMHTEGVE
ncbi:MAG: hypothetical protein R3A80_09565 [Bdellovibrionota bacterium]